MSDVPPPRPRGSPSAVVGMIVLGTLSGLILGFVFAFVVGLFAIGGNFETAHISRSAALTVIVVDYAPWVAAFFFGVRAARKGRAPLGALLMSAAAAALLPVMMCTTGLFR